MIGSVEVNAGVQRHRDRMAERSREHFRIASDIGELPKVVNQDRKAACEFDLFAFLSGSQEFDSYFPESTGLTPFSSDHRRFIEQLQSIILTGGRKLEAVYRGFAKTTIGESACIWAAIYGHARYIPLLGFDQKAADSNLDSIKVELSTNGELIADFPEVCYPLVKLEGKTQACASQTYLGERTAIRWTTSRIVLPTMPKSAGSGVCIETKGLLKCRRGMKHKTADGRNIRPGFVFIDDPQDEESAVSPEQVKKRIDKLGKNVLQLGSHQVGKVAVFIAGTVIEPDDFMDQLLDIDKFPAWNAHRVPMVKAFAKTHKSHWLGEYATLRRNFNRHTVGDDIRARKEAMEHYQENRLVMDEGCVVSWDQCYSRDPQDYEVSAIQHAYNILIDDGQDVFDAECQNDPARAKTDIDVITAKAMTEKVSGFNRYVVPPDATHLTCFVDVQGKALYYVTVAWTADVKGYVIDYGTFPEQRTRKFRLRALPRTLRKTFRGADTSGAIFLGLDGTSDLILGRRYKKPDGSELRVNLMLVDANWGDETKTVKSWAHQTLHANVLTSHGRFIGPDNLPIAQWTTKPGDQVGEEWIIHKPAKRDVRSVTFDTNYFKTLTMHALTTPRETTGSMHLYKEAPSHHDQLSQHHIIELPETKKGQRREMTIWKVPPSKSNLDNHWWDCMVGNRVAASIVGLSSLPVEKSDRQLRQKRKRRKVRQ